jgi:hypothetical protein
LRRAGIKPEDEESACDIIGAALIMPRPLVRRVQRIEGESFVPIVLAEAVVCTQTAAVLRHGEALGQPVAAVSPGKVRVRGPETWRWPDERALRFMATATKTRPGIKRVTLTDQKGRIALHVEDEDAIDVA